MPLGFSEGLERLRKLELMLGFGLFFRRRHGMKTGPLRVMRESFAKPITVEGVYNFSVSGSSGCDPGTDLFIEGSPPGLAVCTTAVEPRPPASWAFQTRHTFTCFRAQSEGTRERAQPGQLTPEGDQGVENGAQPDSARPGGSGSQQSLRGPDVILSPGFRICGGQRGNRGW